MAPSSTTRQYVPWFLPWATRSPTDEYADGQPATPLVPFGFGLSYTQFTLSDAKLSASSVRAGGNVTLTLKIASSGPAGACVVQVYFSQDLASRVRYQRMLLGFGKYSVPANSGGTTVSLELDVNKVDMWDKVQRAYVVEPSNYTLYVAQHSEDRHAMSLPLEITAP